VGADIGSTSRLPPVFQLIAMATRKGDRKKSKTDLDPAAQLFAWEKKHKENPKATRSQTPLPPVAGHHGRRRRGGERPAGRSGGGEGGESSTVAENATGAKLGQCNFKFSWIILT